MQAKGSPFLLLAACFFALNTHVVADPPVTFEILADFAYPPGAFTQPYAINDGGDVAGYFGDQSSGDSFGFVRYREGGFSMPIVDPNDGIGYTVVRGANDSNILCGFYRRSDLTDHGFVLSGDTFTDVAVPGATDTFVTGINDAGALCGNTYTSPTIMGFVSINSVVTSFTVPGALWTFANAINNQDESVGAYNVGNESHGFRRDADGALQYPIDAPGATFTFLNGINDQGAMVGEADDRGAIRGVFFQSTNKAALFEYPGASVTIFTGINNRGLICGYYQTPTNMISRGFVVRVRPATEH